MHMRARPEAGYSAPVTSTVRARPLGRLWYDRVPNVVHSRRLRGREVVVVGATGRTPRGWWGDGTIGRVLELGLFDERRPELLHLRSQTRLLVAHFH